LGVAESARDIAPDLVRDKSAPRDRRTHAGKMETVLRAAQLAHGAMIAAVERNAP
jgi:indole-3-acetate monooxygenase